MLKKLLPSPFAAVAFAAVVSLTLQAYAADNNASIGISIVDVQSLLEKSTAVVKIREQIDKKAEELQKEFSKKGDHYFKKKYEDLEKQKAVLSKEALDKKSEELQKEYAEVQKKAQENRASLDKAYNEAMQQVDASFTEIVKEEAKKSGTRLVIHKGQALYADDSLDISDKVIEALNKKLPGVTVKF